jgi:hypothetical protein
LSIKTVPSEEGPPSLAIGRPEKLDPIATVIALELTGPPEAVDVAEAVRPGVNGVLLLKAADADIRGQTAQYEQGGGKDNIGFWTRLEDYVTWTCLVPKSGRYTAEITYACPDDNAGSKFTVGLVDGANLDGTVKATGSWTQFNPETLGEIELPSGKRTVAVRPVTMPRGAVMNLQSVKLSPAR